jgi:pilus assembly protein CpaE
MTILYEPNRREAQQFAGLLGSDVFTATTASDLASMLVANPGELLVVLGPGVELADSLAIAAEYRVSRPSMGVILMRERLDVGLLGEAIRAGVREVVAAGDPAGLLAACARSLDVSRQMGPLRARRGQAGSSEYDARIITVFAAKGGCGKTTLATNIAVALAAGGARRVGLLDLDLAFGDVAIMLQLVPERSIADAVGLGDQLDETSVRALLTPYGPGLDTLLAPAGPAEAERVSQGLVADILRLARGMFDFLVVDTPPQFTDHVLTALDASAVHVLLTTPDIPALKNLRITLDTFDLLELPKHSRLVVLNRSDAKVGLEISDAEEAVGMEAAVQIPSSREIPTALNIGTPVVKSLPKAEVSKRLQQLSQLFAPITDAQKPKRGWRR